MKKCLLAVASIGLLNSSDTRRLYSQERAKFKAGSRGFRAAACAMHRSA